MKNKNKWFVFVVLLLFPFVSNCNSGWPTLRGTSPSGVHWNKVWDVPIGSKSVFFVDYLWQTFSSVTVGENALYVGSSAGEVFALSPEDGRVLWKKKLKGPVFSTPLLLAHVRDDTPSLLLVGDDAGELVAMDAKTGEIRWTYLDKSPIRSVPAYDQGMIFILGSDGTLNAIRAQDGAWVWGHERSALSAVSIRSSSKSPVVHDGIVYAGFLDGYMVAFQSQTGEVLWSKKVVDEQNEIYDVFTPVIRKELLFVSSYEGGVYALGLKDGMIRWHYDIHKKYHLNAGSIAVDDTAGTIYVTIGSGGIHALDSGGNILWRQLLKEGGEVSTPVIVGNYLVFGASEKGLYLIDRTTGSLEKYFRISNVARGGAHRLVPWNGVTGTPTVVGSRIYFVTNQERVYALDIQEK